MNTKFDYDSKSDILHLELAMRPESSTIVHYIDHPHVALLLDEKTRQAIGFHIEAVSEFIRPGIISKLEMLKELWRDKTLTDYSKALVLGMIVEEPVEITDEQMARIVEHAKVLEPLAKSYLDNAE